MSTKTRKITELSLTRDMNERVHTLVRELAMACKKMAIYGPGHPLSTKAVDKPYLVLQSIFQYKRFVNLFVQKGNLFVLNISIKDTVFTGQILQYLQLLEISALLLERDLSLSEFVLFVENLVQRHNLYDPAFNLAVYLADRRITSIQVNSERAFALFENGKQYRGDVNGDFSLKRLAFDQIGSDPVRLAELYTAPPDKLETYHVDFDSDIVLYLIPERIAGIAPARFRELLNALVATIKSGDVPEAKRQQAANEYASLFRLVSYHPDRDLITSELDPAFREEERREAHDHNATGAIKLESQSRVDRLMDELFMNAESEYGSAEFADAFYRLLSTGQRDKAQEITVRLMDLMSSPDPATRQQALDLLLAVLAQLKSGPHQSMIRYFVSETCKRLGEERETFEYSEFIWRLFEKCESASAYDMLAELVESMSSRRTQRDEVTVYDSMAIKKALDEINHPAVIDRLVSELVEARGEPAALLRRVLIALGSEQVALALSSIISHPVRNVRQQCLRILAELGKASLKVFTAILSDDSYFDREPGRYELPGPKWYVVRNSIFVLGSLGDRGGVVPLRLRLSDRDVRVRREIVSALEKIGGEDAVDCLIFMAEDADGEIREAAIVAIGLVGDQDAVPLLIDLVQRTRTEVARVVSALGKLGGEDARQFLCELMENEKLLSELAGGRISRDDLRIAVVKAIGQIGGDTALEKVKNFRDNLSAAQKLFFKKSALNKAITEVLASK